MRIMTYDDLLTRLNQTLKGPSGAAAAASPTAAAVASSRLEAAAAMMVRKRG